MAPVQNELDRIVSLPTHQLRVEWRATSDETENYVYVIALQNPSQMRPARRLAPIAASGCAGIGRLAPTISPTDA